MDNRHAENVLEEFHQKTLHGFIPLICIMAVVGLFGIIGNAFTIGFYGFVAKKSPTVFLITALAVVDLVVTVLIFPNIAEMAVNVNYTNAVACKIMHFCGHFPIEVSALTLGFIAIDRYRHVCHPFKRQVSFVIAKRTLIVITVFSFLMSLRDLVNFDIIEVPIDGGEDNKTEVVGHYCTTREDSKYKLSITLFHSIDAVLVVVILGALIFSYGNIIWAIRKGSFSLALNKTKEENTEQTGTEDITRETSQGQSGEIERNEEEGSKKDETDTGAATEPKSEAQMASTTARKKIKNTERSITLMMLAVSVVFFLCFVPYFIVKIGIRSYSSASQLELGVGIQLVIRLTYVNSFANPYIFCIFNPQLRRFILGTIIQRKSGPCRH